MRKHIVTIGTIKQSCALALPVIMLGYCIYTMALMDYCNGIKV